ncbi:MAG: hypothetical protein Q7T62_04420 [Undibacterium sp.]|nr:hypothetical protein [Undibacterium sp.]
MQISSSARSVLAMQTGYWQSACIDAFHQETLMLAQILLRTPYWVRVHQLAGK